MIDIEGLGLAEGTRNDQCPGRKCAPVYYKARIPGIPRWRTRRTRRGTDRNSVLQHLADRCRRPSPDDNSRRLLPSRRIRRADNLGRSRDSSIRPGMAQRGSGF